MSTLQIDRRGSRMKSGVGEPDPALIVQRGLLVQAHIGTLGAVEYLKRHDIESTIIGWVLTAELLRTEDQLVLAQSR